MGLTGDDVDDDANDLLQSEKDTSVWKADSTRFSLFFKVISIYLLDFDIGSLVWCHRFLDSF